MSGIIVNVDNIWCSFENNNVIKLKFSFIVKESCWKSDYCLIMLIICRFSALKWRIFIFLNTLNYMSFHRKILNIVQNNMMTNFRYHLSFEEIDILNNAEKIILCRIDLIDPILSLFRFTLIDESISHIRPTSIILKRNSHKTWIIHWVKLCWLIGFNVNSFIVLIHSINFYLMLAYHILFIKRIAWYSVKNQLLWSANLALLIKL